MHLFDLGWELICWETQIFGLSAHDLCVSLNTPQITTEVLQGLILGLQINFNE